MFGSRRRRGANLPLRPATISPEASRAAAVAMSTKPTPSLSAAAAAAALKARPHTPTNVGQVQTKRTMRRSPSVSTVGSGRSVRRSMPALERKTSSGSMRERSFRTPSPHQGHPAHASQPEPPVPAIPDSHRRLTGGNAAVVGMQNFQVASQRLAAAGHPSWYTHPTGSSSKVRKSDAALPTLKSPRRGSAVSTTARPDSRSSVNFSYPYAKSPPISPTDEHKPPWNEPPPNRPASPPPSRRTSLGSPNTTGRSEQALVYDANSRRMIPKTDLMPAQQNVSEATTKQPKAKQKESVTYRSKSGSRAAKGTVASVQTTVVHSPRKEQEGRGPDGEEPYEAMEEPQGLEPHASDANVPDACHSVEGAHKPQARQLDADSMDRRESIDSTDLSERTTSPKFSKAVTKKPSTVAENSDEDEEDVHDEQWESLRRNQAEPFKPMPEAASAVSSRVAGATRERLASPTGLLQVEEVSRESSVRSDSGSPTRTARFAASRSERLSVRHVPLPRSASPIKSALKNRSGSQDVSVSDNGSAVGTAVPEQESGQSRKKSVRVSFDDRNIVVVGEAAPTNGTVSPFVASPQQGKRAWYGIMGRSKKTDYDMDDDEAMPPRPALPVFGSIRDKKSRGAEERRLVRPQEPSHSPPAPLSPELPPTVSAPTVSPSASLPKTDEATLWEQSATGQSTTTTTTTTILGDGASTQDHASRNPPNISRFREPLPPIVTSIQDTGPGADGNDGNARLDTGEGQLDSGGSDSDAGMVPYSQPMQRRTLDAQQAGETHGERVPDIAITQPTPPAVKESVDSGKANNHHYFEVPGTFPVDGEDAEAVGGGYDVVAPGGLSESTSVFEPSAVLPVQTTALAQTSIVATPQADDYTDSESDGSIYSDAYEDLSDMDGGGFQSLDAVVESPDETVVPKAAIKKPTQLKHSDSRADVHPAVQAQMFAQAPVSVREEDDWEQAKAFWRSLTGEKRRQLEAEALDDAAMDGDREDAEAPVRRLSSRKKSSEQKQATTMAIKARAAAAVAKTASNPTSKPASKPKTTKSANADGVRLGTKVAHEPDGSPAPAGGRLRTSMRGEKTSRQKTTAASGGVHMRRSMRSSASAGPAESAEPGATTRRLAKQAPPSASLSHSTTRLPGAAGHGGSASSGLAASGHGGSDSGVQHDAASTLLRRGSDASDSSFKRRRAGKSNGVSLRKSMRQKSAPQPDSRRDSYGSARFSLRSVSPAGSHLRRTSTASGMTVSSMAGRTLRSSSQVSLARKRSPLHFPSFGRAPKPVDAVKPSKPASRFAHSSDDEAEPAASAFRTRFADSSEEEEAGQGRSVPQPRPNGASRETASARIIKKKASTVLEEKEDGSVDLADSEHVSHRPVGARHNTANSGADALLRPSAVRSNSGIGTSTLQRPRPGQLTIADRAPEVAKEHRTSFMSGILRRNKRIGLSRQPSKSTPTSPVDVQSPRSVRRIDSWPLPESADEDVRPVTSGGPRKKRDSALPSNLGRRSTALGLPGTDTAAAAEAATRSSLNGKKKKFGALRRIFRLDD